MILTSLSAPLLAASLTLGGGLSDNQRMALLTPFFHPAPATLVKVDPYERRNSKVKDFLNLRGYIMVTPPVGQCFTVSVLPSDTDKYICKKTELSFTLEHLDEKGFINVKVAVDGYDTGTILSWPTPYRLMQILKDKNNDTTSRIMSSKISDYVPIEQCTAEKIDGQRRVTLTLFDRTVIAIDFPEQGQLAPQPPDPPNLYIHKIVRPLDRAKDKHAKEVQKDKEKEKGKEKEKEGEKEHNAEGAKKGEGAAAGAIPEAPPAVITEEMAIEDQLAAKLAGTTITKKEVDEDEIAFDAFIINKKPTLHWMLKPRGTYVMDSSHVMMSGSARNKAGICRYRMTGAPDDAGSGVIECFSADSYYWFYANLSCSPSLLH